MKINNKLMLFLIATMVTFFGIGYNLIKGTKAVDTDSIAEQQREAIMQTALAYYRQGNQIQYDSYRKNLYATPEDATSQHPFYTVGSGFTFQVYYQTLGIKIPDTTEGLLNYAEANQDNTDTILYYYDSNVDTDINSSTAFSDFIEGRIQELEVGDIFIITGHAMMVKSIDTINKNLEIIAVNGSRYQISDKQRGDIFDENGAVIIRTISTLESNIERFAFIRIITDGEHYINTNNKTTTYEVADSAISRLNYREIDIEKTAKISNREEMSNVDEICNQQEISDVQEMSQSILANIGEYITYKITITNNSDNDYDGFEVIENINSKVIVSNAGTGEISNNQIKWNVTSLAAGCSKVLEYTVKVPINKDLFGEVIVSTGHVDNIATSKIETVIGNKLSNAEKEKIKSAYDNLENNQQIEREFINQIYLDALGLNLGLTNLDNLDIISFDDSVGKSGQESFAVKYTRVNDTSVSKYIYNNFYGLRIGASSSESASIASASQQWNIYPNVEVNDRARTLSSDMLNDGDILLVYNGQSSTIDENLVNKAYIFLDGKLIRKISSNDFEELTDDNLMTFLRNIIGENYIILRPSLAYGNMYNLSIEISSDRYAIDDENKYIYVGTDTDENFIKDNISVQDDINIDIANNKLQVKYDEDVLDEYSIISINFGSLLADENNIDVSADNTYDNFTQNVLVTGGGSYKIFNGTDEVTSGDIFDGSVLKVYYNDVELDSYNIIVFSLSFHSSLNVDDENKYIKDISKETKLSEILSRINVMGGRIVIYDDETYQKVKGQDDVIGSGDVLVIYVGESIKNKYTFSVTGDANGDGVVNLIDLIQLRKHIVGWVHPETKIVQNKTGVYYDAIDMNRDGQIDLIDLIRMRKTIVGLI